MPVEELTLELCGSYRWVGEHGGAAAPALVGVEKERHVVAKAQRVKASLPRQRPPVLSAKRPVLRVGVRVAGDPKRLADDLGHLLMWVDGDRHGVAGDDDS